jgi:hypothetical protein
MNTLYRPLVTCIMPTSDRRAFVPDAIRYFLRQDYQWKELLIVDDGSDNIRDLVPADARIRYIRLSQKMTLGEKRNYCVRESRGDLIMHWDDDDWMAPHRISYQVKELVRHNAEVCGLREMLFYEPGTGRCWVYKYPTNARAWLAGGSLLYTREFWKKGPFPDMQVASDTQFIFSRELKSYVALPDSHFYVASVHANNTSRKITTNRLFHPIPSMGVKSIMGEDWVSFGRQHNPIGPATRYSTPPPAATPPPPPPGPPPPPPPPRPPPPPPPRPPPPPPPPPPARVSAPIVNSRKKVAVLLTTCNRPGPLKKVTDGLDKEKGKIDLEYFIADDAFLGNGKKKYWATVNFLWGQVRNKNFDYFIQLPDDVEWDNDLIGEAIDLWENISDPKKICLNLLLDSSRVGKTCWTNYWPRLKSFRGSRYLLSQWVDMIFISDRKFFEQLDWNILPVSAARWDTDPQLSSGVGQQISHRLLKMGWNMYQVTEKIMEHTGADSIMNPDVRRQEPMHAAELPLIYAGMASIPEREQALKKAIDSVHPYIDHLFLYLNEYDRIPDWLRLFPKLTTFLGRREGKDMGDGGKFFGLDKIGEKDYYFFPLDDDMIYPADYVWKMKQKIDAFQRRAVVGCGGYIMKPSVRHFYNDRHSSWHISMPNDEDRPVQVLHTGLTAWHSSALRFSFDDCKKANMSDLWLALAAQKHEVPMIVIQRPANWVDSLPIPPSRTIYGRYHIHCHEQTSVFNSWKEWKILSPKDIISM